MVTIACPLNEAARMSPNQAGIISKDGALLFTEVEQCVVATTELLVREGVEKGEYLGLLLDQGWESVILFWSILRLGAIVCPLYPGGDKAHLEGILKELTVRRVLARKDPEIPGITFLDVASFTGFTGKFKATYRPVLDLNAPAVVQFSLDDKLQPVYLCRSVASYYYGAQGGNGVMPLGTNKRWMLRPFYTWQGPDCLFRCWMAGAGVVPLNEALPTYDDINTYEISHVTVGRGQVKDLLSELARGEHELTYALLEYVPTDEEYETFKQAGLFVVPHLDTATCGYFASVDRAGSITPFKRVEFEQDEDGRLRIRNNALSTLRVVAGERLPYVEKGQWVDAGRMDRDRA